jgi:hypothetical protein
MPKQTLKLNLARLREELAEPANLDAETRQQLAEVADTIEQVLGTHAPDYQGAQETVESIALAFEARHPNFSRILREVTDALTKLGI